MKGSTLSNGKVFGSRVVVEGLTIVLSILAAFMIDAWWDGRVQQSRAAEHLQQLSIQLSANAEVLAEARLLATRARDASRALTEAIGPVGADLPSDSLARLLDDTFRVNVGALELSALDAVLSEGGLAARAGPELQRALIQYRNRASTFAVENALYLEARRDLIDTLIDLNASVRVVIARGSDLDASDFPLPTTELLRDVKLESRVFEIGLLANRTLGAVVALEETSGRVLDLMGAGVS